MYLRNLVSCLSNLSKLVIEPPLKTLPTPFSHRAAFASSSLLHPNEELTLAILKPDLVANPTDLATVKSLILDADFRVVRERRLRLTDGDAHRFYAEHHDKFFFNRLVTYMTSGDIEACVLAKPDAIAAWRRLMGPTKVLRAIYEQPTSLRGRFGLTDTRNATHGSDSVENARKEITFFFPDFFDEEREEETLERTV